MTVRKSARNRVTPGAEDLGYIDLNKEIVMGPDGKRLTEADTVAFTIERERKRDLDAANRR